MLRLGAMSVAIAAGVGVFLAAQQLHVIPEAWSEESSASLAVYHLSDRASAYDAAIAASPDDYMVYYRRGLHYRTQGQMERSLADLDRAVALSPKPQSRALLGDEAQNTLSLETRTLNRVVFVHLMRADVLTVLGRQTEALEELNRAIALDERKYSAVFARAALLTAMGRYDEAIADYDALLARRPEVAWSFGRGRAKYEKGDYTAAAADFAAASHAQPEDDEFRSWLTKASLRAEIAAQ